MFKIIKNFNWIILSSFLSIFMGIVTFLTFINEGFVPLTDTNLQTLLIIDILFLLIFFTLINHMSVYCSHQMLRVFFVAFEDEFLCGLLYLKFLWNSLRIRTLLRFSGLYFTFSFVCESNMCQTAKKKKN